MNFYPESAGNIRLYGFILIPVLIEDINFTFSLKDQNILRINILFIIFLYGKALNNEFSGKCSQHLPMVNDHGISGFKCKYI